MSAEDRSMIDVTKEIKRLERESELVLTQEQIPLRRRSN